MSGNGNHLLNKKVELGKKWNKKSKERYLPYRREGYYGYIGDVDELTQIREPLKVNILTSSLIKIFLIKR